MNWEKTDRRRFLQYSAILGGGMAFSPLFPLRGNSLRGHPSSIQNKELYWYQKPLRILQTVLREPDARDYDPDAVVSYMEKAGCNTLVVSGGGIVDFFKNPLPAANINPFMGNRDLLKEITESCHKAGIRVIARVDFRGVEEKIYRQFPDWFALTAEQKPLQLNYTRPRLYASCYTGVHRNQHAEEFIRHLVGEYHLDGIWHNSIGVDGICYCPHCKAAFRDFSGKDLPIPATASPEELAEYMAWKTLAADKHMGRMKTAVKSFGPDKVYTAEVFSMYEAGGQINSGIDLYNARDHFDFLVSVAFLTENSEHIRYADLNYAGTIIKFLKSMAPEKEAIILYGGNGTAFRYVMDPPVDLKVWLWEALASGGRFWNCNFTGSFPDATYDRRNAYNNTEAYHFVRKHESLLTHQVPVADIGLYYSRPTRIAYRTSNPEGEHFETSLKGMETVLTENHIPYDFIADDQISPERLKKYRLILLPNVKCLSAKELSLLSDYVAQGGHLIATYETSLYDEKGTSRQDFGLSELFGCHYTGEKIDTRKDHYQHIALPQHPLVKPDSEKTELLINAGYTLLCQSGAEAVKICTYVPLVHNQPPEKAWTDEWKGEHPTVQENTFQKGKVIYFSNQPDRVSYENGHPDTRNLLLRSIAYLAPEALRIETDAPESVHIGLTRSSVSPGEYIFSMVNTSSAPVRPLRNLIPVHKIRVNLHLGGSPLQRFKILRSQGPAQILEKDGKINLHLELLEDYFSVHLQLKS